ncbi:MAG TPA: FtsW/RodA/SpoVE family cell cycle protein [Thermomicrobiales bacterium]|nr:FtsW/RodA/SpoVE family cell cycle protein [Thermomicrobiales bacterium]
MTARFRPTFRSTEFGLLIFPALIAIIGAAIIVLVPRARLDWSWSEIWVGLAFAGAVLIMSLSLGIRGFRGDQTILPLTAMIAIIGLLMIQRLHPDLAEISDAYSALAQRHLMYLAAGLVIMWLTVMLLGPIGFVRWLQRYRYLIILSAIALQISTYFIGTEVYGAKLWIEIGPVQIQPSEIVKLALVAFLASYLDENRDLLASGWKVGPLTLPPIPYLIPMGVMWAACLLTLIVLNDLGSALLFFGIFLTMLYVATGGLVYVAVGLGSFIGAAYVAWLTLDRIGIRVQNWLNPWADPLDTGFQPVHSDYALATGGVFGVGLGYGSPTYIPEVQTDYIFSAIGEELGLLGALAVICLYLFFVVRGFTIALRARDGYIQLFAAGLSSIIAVQTIIIVGGVTRIIPLTGITLPLISYGGSALLTNFALAGMLLYVSGLPKRV